LSHTDKAFFTTFVGILAALAIAAIIFFFIANAITNDSRNEITLEQVEENIKPVGEVNVAGEAAAPAPPAAEAPAETSIEAPATAAAPAAPVAEVQQARSGQEIFQSKCAACHTTGVAGAPKVGDKQAWAPRIAQGMDTMLGNATNGLRAMPPMGTCMDCSREELRAAIQYMVEQSE
jgi:cytochrome c5